MTKKTTKKTVRKAVTKKVSKKTVRNEKLGEFYKAAYRGRKEGLTARQAIVKAKSETGVSLPASYDKFPNSRMYGIVQIMEKK